MTDPKSAPRGPQYTEEQMRVAVATVREQALAGAHKMMQDERNRVLGLFRRAIKVMQEERERFLSLQAMEAVGQYTYAWVVLQELQRQIEADEKAS